MMQNNAKNVQPAQTAQEWQNACAKVDAVQEVQTHIHFFEQPAIVRLSIEVQGGWMSLRIKHATQTRRPGSRLWQ